MLLLLIRHGLTKHVGVKLSGWTSGVDLSPEGRAQADRLAERLSGVALDAIYTSPLERAVQTAAPVARAHGLRPKRRDALGEVHYGSIEGKSLRALAKTPLWTALRAWPSDVRFPGGESLRETQVRGVAAVEEIRAAHSGQTVAVFSHGDWIRLVLAHFSGVHIDLYRRLAVDPVSVSAISLHSFGPQIMRMNDTGDLAHLVPAKKAAATPAVRSRGAR